MAPPGLHILVQCTKSDQSSVECQCSPSRKCRDTPQTRSLPTVSSLPLHLPHQQISLSSLTFSGGIVPWSQSLSALLHDLGFDASLFSLYRLCGGEATMAYRQVWDQIDIKRQGLWTSNTFW